MGVKTIPAVPARNRFQHPEAIIVEVAEAEPAPLRNRPVKPVDPASQLATAGDATALSVDAEVLTNDWAVQVGAFSRFKAAHVSAKEDLEMAATTLAGAEVSIERLDSPAIGVLYRSQPAGLYERQARPACTQPVAPRHNPAGV